jgi:hypothetical protein
VIKLCELFPPAGLQFEMITKVVIVNIQII